MPIPDADLSTTDAGDAHGTLVLAGTPLGNPADASPRLARLLAEADLVAAEDTRRLHRLLRDLGVHRDGPVVSFYEDVERARLPTLMAALAGGGTVAVVTDAGMPSVSDPGFRAVRAAVAAGHRVTSLPGPSAVTTSLAVSGLPCDRFCFEGFLPRRAAERRTRIAELVDEPRTQVYFESPHRVAATLADLAEAFGGERAAALCRELSKTYEEVVRGTLSEVAAWSADGVRGEVTLVVAGADPSASVGPVDAASLAARVAALIEQGIDRKQAQKLVAESSGVTRREVYDAVIAARSAERDASD